MSHSHIVVTGTGTGVGKTVASACLTLGMRGSYWKPVQSGCAADDVLRNGDRGLVQQMTGLPFQNFFAESYCFPEPLSPHRAAELAGAEIDVNSLIDDVPSATNGPLIIEGAGGLLVPLTRTVLYADVFAAWQFPLIIVASTELGTINHTLMTVEAARSRGIPILGLVFSGRPMPDNRRTIMEFTKLPLIGFIPHLDTITPTVLSDI